ncbi:MAG: hypothetical protein JNK37_19270 [Verrucomicrobiales bacterium]|nr:hypothetical protein [Verrucomicrobiales bacterium]
MEGPWKSSARKAVYRIADFDSRENVDEIWWDNISVYGVAISPLERYFAVRELMAMKNMRKIFKHIFISIFAISIVRAESSERLLKVLNEYRMEIPMPIDSDEAFRVSRGLPIVGRAGVFPLPRVRYAAWQIALADDKDLVSLMTFARDEDGIVRMVVCIRLSDELSIPQELYFDAAEEARNGGPAHEKLISAILDKILVKRFDVPR